MIYYYRNEIVVHAPCVPCCVIYNTIVAYYVPTAAIRLKTRVDLEEFLSWKHTRRRYYLIIFTLFYYYYLPSCRNDLYLIRTRSAPSYIHVYAYNCQRERFVVTLGPL